jgi:hypothetical protein
MKIFAIISFTIICLVSCLSSCQREDLGNLNAIFADTTQNGAVAKMTAKINGVPWTAAYYDVSLQSGSPGEIVITGESLDGRIISLTIASHKAGDYLLSQNSYASYAPDTITTSYYNSFATFRTGGVINIASIDSAKLLMSGQFNFIAARSDGTTRSITEGNFTNLDFTNISVNTRFSAKYNGNLWNPENVNTSISLEKLIIVASITSDSKPSTITLSMPKSVQPNKYGYFLTAPSATGKYKATYEESGYTLVPNGSSSHNYPYTPCILKISSNDTIIKKIKGTFSFYGVNQNDLTANGSRLTGGVFDLNY